MKDADFELLVTSVRQAGRIKRGELAGGLRTLEGLSTMLAEKIDSWNDKIREEGRKEGLQEGLREGRAGVLLRQLRFKFSSLSPEVEERVLSTDADRLLEWSDRVLTAERLQDVFGD